MGFALSDMQLASTAFRQGEAIPRKHAGEGDDVSPVLSWHAAPDETQSFVLVCHDPDAPLVANRTYGFTHWLLALDSEPELPAGLDLPALLDRIEPNVIAMNRLVGTYQRD